MGKEVRAQKVEKRPAVKPGHCNSPEAKGFRKGVGFGFKAGALGARGRLGPCAGALFWFFQIAVAIGASPGDPAVGERAGLRSASQISAAQRVLKGKG